ncbi:MAG: amidase [Chitinophagales bacterium]|nr:amidase [Chitinophagales bacterium]MCZ2393458.1 amidase [Chitinophagales bacterium]
MSNQVHAFTNDVLGNLDAVGIATAIREKKISVGEVTHAAIERAEKVNSQLGAIVLKTYDDARNMKQVNQQGFFYGVPTFIKDNENIKGHPSQFGTGVFKAKVATANGSFANQMLHTGLNYLGKTSLPEFGLICSTENEKWGITRNPWSIQHTTGGSSSGSAAMVASGVVPIAHANDGAGSIRIPASCCGLVGLKPSRNRLVNFDGSQVLPINIGYQGVLTRSVRDTAAFMFEAEKFFKNSKMPSIGNVVSPLKKRLKIAFFENQDLHLTGHVDEDTHRVLKETANLLSSLGHIVEEIKIPIDIDHIRKHFLNYYGFIAFLETRMLYLMSGEKFMSNKMEPFSYGLSNRFAKNPLRIFNSINVLKKTITQLEKDLLKRYDILLTPVTALRTPEIGYFSPLLSSKEIIRRASFFAPFAGMQNVTGAPAISLPMGVDSRGLPLGMQFSSLFGQDALLLELAYELELARPWKHLFNVG